MQGLTAEPPSPLFGLLWTRVHYAMKQQPPPELYLERLLSDWALDITGQPEVSAEVRAALDKAAEALLEFREMQMVKAASTKEVLRQLATQIERNERYWIRRLFSGKVIVEPARTDYMAYALYLVVTEGSEADLKEAINDYLWYNTNTAVYLPEWYDVRQSVFYPVLLRIADLIHGKMPQEGEATEDELDAAEPETEEFEF